MKTKKEKLIPTEYEEQLVLVEWLEWNKYKFTSIPNSTYTKSWKQKMNNKRMGLRAGLPDLLIIGKNKLIFIELKRIKGGKVSEYQDEWINELNKIKNVIAIICYGAEDAINKIKIIEDLK